MVNLPPGDFEHMRPVTRPHASAAYQAIEAAAEDACTAAQQALFFEWTYNPIREKLYDPIDAYYSRRLAPQLDFSPDKSLLAQGDVQLRQAFDVAWAQLQAGMGAAPDWKGMPESQLRPLTAAALAALQKLDTLVARADAQITAAAKAYGKAYPKARGDLVAGLGQYCSYCELPMSANLAVEHMVPKSTFPQFAARWDNFLLCCSACNSRKLDQPDYRTYQQAAGADATRQSALASMRFPTDAGYTNFVASFGYRLNATDQDGVPDPRAPGAAGGNIAGPPELVDMTARGPVARVGYIVLRAAVPDAADQAQLAALATGGAAQAPNAVPAALRNSFAVLADLGGYSAEVEENSAARLAFRLSHSVTYRFDTSGVKLKVTRPGGAPQELNVRSRIAQGWLLTGAVPRDILLSNANLGYRYLPDVTVTALPAGVTRTQYDVTVADRYRCELDLASNVLTVAALVTTPYMLEIFARPAFDATGAQAADLAKKTIERLDLNDERALGKATRGGRRKRDDDDNNLVNRRVAWRTRTWFVAQASLERAKSASAMAQANPATASAAEFELLVELIGQTMRHTGCWSVWMTVGATLPAPPANATPATVPFDVATRLRALATDLFPGTR